MDFFWQSPGIMSFGWKLQRWTRKVHVNTCHKQVLFFNTVVFIQLLFKANMEARKGKNEGGEHLGLDLRPRVMV